MTARSVFAVDRGIWDDADFSDEPFTEREAWLWLVSSAAWKSGRTRGNSGPILLERGEFSFSVRFLAERWHWSKDKAHRFIKRLENRDMIRDTSRDTSQVYSIKNYNHFQVVGVSKRDTVETQTATTTRHDRDKEETGKQENKDSSLRSEAGVSVKKKCHDKVVVVLIPEWVPAGPWGAFVEMRLQMQKKNKIPFTDEARRLCVLDLDRLRTAGYDPAAVINQTIAKGWRTFFALKGVEPASPPQGQLLLSDAAAKVSSGTGSNSDYFKRGGYVGLDHDQKEKQA